MTQQRIDDLMHDIHVAAIEAANVLVAEFAPIIEQVTAASNVILDAFRESYVRIGEPYGPGDDAMMAYFADIAGLLRRDNE